MSDYIPKSDADFKAWLENLETQATAAGATLGITAGDITTVGSSLESVRDTMAALADLTVRARQATQEKKAARRAAEEFARKLAKKIKGHTAYNEGFGQQLRITGPEDTTDLATAKPDLEGISHPNGTIELSFTKSKSDGVNIYSQRDGETQFVYLARDTNSPYVDNRSCLVMGKPEVRRYKAVYVVNDEEIGLSSDEVPVTCQV